MEEVNTDILKYVITIMVALAFVIIPSSLSVYKSGSNSSKTISLAKWDVELNQDDENGTLSVIPNATTATYTINIEATSEVDMEYVIVVSNLPAGIEVSVDNGAYRPQSNNSITFDEDWTILYSDVDKTRSHVLTFRATSGAAAISNQNVDISVIAQQSI